MPYNHTYEDVKSYRASIQEARERLQNQNLSDRESAANHEAVECFEKWIGEAGYQLDYRQGEEPIAPQSIAKEAQPETPNYMAYFRLDDGTTDACDFYAKSWIEANKIAHQILNCDYREWIEVAPCAVVRGGETFVRYTHGKKPVGKRFARIVGLKFKEVQL